MCVDCNATLWCKIHIHRNPPIAGDLWRFRGRIPVQFYVIRPWTKISLPMRCKLPTQILTSPAPVQQTCAYFRYSHTEASYVYMCRDDGGGTNVIRNAPCAFNYIIYPIFVQCYVMGRFGHENGQFWSCFSSIGAVLVGPVLVCVGRFRPSLGPFWRWAVLVGSFTEYS